MQIRRNARRVLVAAAVIGRVTVSAAGQEEAGPTTRAEVIAERQAAKAEVLTSEEPSTAEAIVRKVRTVLFDSPGGWRAAPAAAPQGAAGVTPPSPQRCISE